MAENLISVMTVASKVNLLLGSIAHLIHAILYMVYIYIYNYGEKFIAPSSLVTSCGLAT